MVALFRHFVRCSSTLRCGNIHLSPACTTRFIFVELISKRMLAVTKRSRASTFQIVSTRLSKNGTMVTFALDTSFPRHTSTSCHWPRRCGGIWARSLLSCQKLHWSPFEHWPFFFPLVTSIFPFFNATHSLTIFVHCSCFNFPVSGVKIS